LKDNIYFFLAAGSGGSSFDSVRASSPIVSGQFFYDERKLKSYGLASRAPPLSRQRRARFWRVDCGCVPLSS
jgi:hypothetical protein